MTTLVVGELLVNEMQTFCLGRLMSTGERMNGSSVATLQDRDFRRNQLCGPVEKVVESKDSKDATFSSYVYSML